MSFEVLLLGDKGNESKRDDQASAWLQQSLKTIQRLKRSVPACSSSILGLTQQKYREFDMSLEKNIQASVPLSVDILEQVIKLKLVFKKV